MFLGCQEADTFCLGHFNCNTCENDSRRISKEDMRKLLEGEFKEVMDKFDTQEERDAVFRKVDENKNDLNLIQYFDVVKPLYEKDPEFFKKSC